MVKLLEKIQKKLTELESNEEKLTYLHSLLEEIEDKLVLKTIKSLIETIEEQKK